MGFVMLFIIIAYMMVGGPSSSGRGKGSTSQ